METNKNTDKQAGQIDKIKPQSNTEGRQINRQPDGKAERAARLAKQADSHCPAAKLQQGDFGPSLDCVGSNLCVTVHVCLYL